MSKPMPISMLHIIASVNKSSGGPSYSVTRLCDILASLNNKITLVSQKLKHEDSGVFVLTKHPNVNSIALDSYRSFRGIYTPNYAYKLSRIINDSSPKIIHNHGLWLQCNHQSAVLARKYNIPYIVSPRGMLEPWSFAYKAWKKKLVWFLWQKNTLIKATAFCATSRREAENISKLGFHQPIAIIPNGVDLPPYHQKEIRERPAIRYALFLSRIHPIKGLLNLINAWSKITPKNWKVIIAGPDENNHLREVIHEIEALGLQDVFVVMGPVEGEQKSQLYHDASLFILPTFSENFGIAVAEALSSCTPVITTIGAPWGGLITNKCGWWVDIGIDPLAEAIRQATTLPDEELIAMGKRGREYIINEFGWDEIGTKMSFFYDWILNGGTLPDFLWND